MDQQNQNSGNSNNISADDLLKKLRENINLAGDDEIDRSNPKKIGEQIKLPIDDPISDSDNDVSEADEKSDDEPVLNNADSAEAVEETVREYKPLQIQHRYKFRRSSRPKTVAPVQSSKSESNENYAPLEETAYVAEEEAEPTASGNITSSSSDRISENAQSMANEASSEMLERLMKKYMSSDELEKYHPTEEDASEAESEMYESDVEEISDNADETKEIASQENVRSEGTKTEANYTEASENTPDEVSIEDYETVEIAEDVSDNEGEDGIAADADEKEEQLSEENLSEEALEAETLVDADLDAGEDSENPMSEEADVDETEAEEQESDAQPEADPLKSIFNEEFDETDASLMIAFGMEKELEENIGKENVDILSENLSRKNDQITAEAEELLKKSKDIEKKPEEDEEYTAFNQTKEILDRFKAKYKNVTIRMLIVAVAAIILFLFENIGAFGGALPEVLSSSVYPVVHIMADLQLLLFCLVPVYENILDGSKAILQKKPNVNSILTSVTAMTAIYIVIMCFISTGSEFQMYGFPVAICALLALLSERFDLQREVYSFNIVASRRPKYVLGKLDFDQSDLEKQAFSSVLPENPSIFKIEKTSFVNGFFRRSKEYSKNKVVIGAVIPVSIAIAVIVLIVSVFTTKSAAQALSTGYLSFMLCMPLSMIVSYSMPAFKAAGNAYKNESTIVGESALDEYTTASSISFDDKDVFPSGGVKVKSINVFGNGRIDHVIYKVASVFATLGGPLANVLDIATMDMEKSDNVELLQIENDGIEALVDGEHVYVGKASFLRKNQFVPIADPSDEEIVESSAISIMYLVTGDEITAKLYVEYHVDPDFESILKRMYKSGICVGIKTVDPNIDDDLLAKLIRLEKYPVRVLKCREIFDPNTAKEGIDSGIVSKRSTKALLNTFALCDKVQHITKANILINSFAVILGILISAFLIWLNLAAGVFSIYVFLYQLFWILPIYVISKLFI